MKSTACLQEEISKNVGARKHITTQMEYFCSNDEDSNTLITNIREMLTKAHSDNHLAKITYEYDPEKKKVEVVIVEHK